MKLISPVIMSLLAAVLLTSPALAQKAEKKTNQQKKSGSISRVFNGERERTAQFYYNRANIVLLRKSIPKDIPPSMPWLTDEPPPDPALSFDVEVRDGLSMYSQSGWFDMSSYDERSGLMLAFGEPVIKPIVQSTQYAPVDILFIDKQGAITQIVPNILLSNLESEIYPDSPVLAFLFLRGGSSADNYINVGDELQYSIFKKPPLILNAPRPNVPRELPKETLIVPTPNVSKVAPVIYSDPTVSSPPPQQLVEPKPETAAAPVAKASTDGQQVILQKTPEELQKRMK